MPTYEYLCKACSHRFETWQKMIDDPLTICPECGGHIRRVLFPAGIVFKGQGFYKTDHGSGPVTGPKGNGIPEVMKTQHYWIDTIKNACQSCHAIGTKGVRTISPHLGEFKNSLEMISALTAGNQPEPTSPREYAS